MAVSWLSPNSRLRGKFPHVGFHGCFIAAGDRAQLITLSPLKRPVRLGKHASVWGSQEEQQSAHHSLYLGTFRLTPWTNEEEKASGWRVQLMYWCPSSILQLLQYFFGWYFRGMGWVNSLVFSSRESIVIWASVALPLKRSRWHKCFYGVSVMDISVHYPSFDCIT